MVMPDAHSDLELVQSFLNTVDLEEGPDELSNPQALRSWLSQAGLPLAGRKPPTRDDLQRAIAVREALRDLVGVNMGVPLPSDAHSVLQDAARRAGLTMRFRTDGSTVIEPAAVGIDGALGQILAGAHRAMDRGSWRQLKLCRRDCCRWAFLDTSKNRSRRWCSMEICGNREKGAAFRHRRRKTTDVAEG
jgi:predicted RNA-binding Zn ribbon-like protein